jgi:hypothetical protein
MNKIITEVSMNIKLLLLVNSQLHKLVHVHVVNSAKK